MKNLISFQIKRMWNSKSLILLPILLIAIGLSGIFLTGVFYSNDASAKVKLLCVYNSYSQFTFLFLIYLFVSTFSSDFKNGIYSFMNQVGYSKRKCFLSKAVILLTMSTLITDIFIIFANFLFDNNDYEYLGIMLISINLTLIFTVLFAMLLSLLVRKTMPATLIGYGLFVAMDILNFVGYGLTNPADSNSISYTTLCSLAGLEVNHYTLIKLDLNFYEYRYFLIIVPIVLWIAILLTVITIIFKKRGKR